MWLSQAIDRAKTITNKVKFSVLGLLKFCAYFVLTIYPAMDIALIQIGNSKGIRLSKTILEKYQITDTLELILEKGYIILKPKSKPREGWDVKFKAMHENGEDKLLIDDVFNDENLEEWT